MMVLSGKNVQKTKKCAHIRALIQPLSEGNEDKMTTEQKAVNDILTTLSDDTDELRDDTDDPYVVYIQLPTDDSDEQSDVKDD